MKIPNQAKLPMVLGVEGVRDSGFSGLPRDIPGDAEGWVFVLF